MLVDKKTIENTLLPFRTTARGTDSLRWVERGRGSALSIERAGSPPASALIDAALTAVTALHDLILHNLLLRSAATQTFQLRRRLARR
jgi:hypothetical protein